MTDGKGSWPHDPDAPTKEQEERAELARLKTKYEEEA